MGNYAITAAKKSRIVLHKHRQVKQANRLSTLLHPYRQASIQEKDFG